MRAMLMGTVIGTMTLAAAVAQAEPTTRQEVKIPFAFTVNGQEMPAGSYTVPAPPHCGCRLPQFSEDFDVRRRSWPGGARYGLRKLLFATPRTAPLLAIPSVSVTLVSPAGACPVRLCATAAAARRARS